MRVLVCGDRHWNKPRYLEHTLDELDGRFGFTHLIEGEAQGADVMAKQWAIERGLGFTGYPANWFLYRRAAGVIRNRLMLVEGKPDMVVAFHGDIWSSKGTQNMVMQALGAGIPVMIFSGHNREDL